MDKYKATCSCEGITLVHFICICLINPIIKMQLQCMYYHGVCALAQLNMCVEKLELHVVLLLTLSIDFLFY